MIAIAWSCSTNRRQMPWRIVIWGLGLQLALGVLLLKTPAGRPFFDGMNALTKALMTFTDAVVSYQAVGFSPEHAEKFVLSTFQDIGHEYRELTKGEILNAFKWGYLPEEDARVALADLEYSPDAIDWHIQYAEFTRTAKQAEAMAGESDADVEAIRNLTKTDILDGLESGLISADEGVDLLITIGFGEEAANYYILAIQLEQDRKLRRLTVSQIEELYKAEMQDRSQAMRELAAVRYGPREAGIVVSLWDREIRLDKAKAQRPRLSPSRSDLQRWLLGGFLSVDDWVSEMRSIGYGTKHIRLFLEELIYNAQK